MVFFTRRSCSLCEEAKSAIRAAGLEARYDLREVDVDTDRALQDRYGWRVPVLEIAGELALEGRFGTAEFKRRFRAFEARLGDTR